MKIVSAEFEISAAGPGQFPHSVLPEVAFAGKSNVGKSSVINCLLQRKKLVHTSSRPGKTQLVNFFRVNGDFYAVDLPGYGYAKAPKSVQATWATLVEGYIRNRGPLRGLVLIVDIRHVPGPLDVQMAGWLAEVQRHFLVVANKVDQVTAGAVRGHLQQIVDTLGLAEPPVPFSAKTGAGRDALLDRLRPWLESRP